MDEEKKVVEVGVQFYRPSEKDYEKESMYSDDSKEEEKFDE